MDEDLRIQEELESMRNKDNAKRKRERRRENERRQREIVRMQLNMATPVDIGLEESGPIGEDSMFSLRSLHMTDAMPRLSRGKMIVTSNRERDQDSAIAQTEDGDEQSDNEQDRLERQLDSMYHLYRERKADIDGKYRARKARKDWGDEEWEGLSESATSQDTESSYLKEADDSTNEYDNHETPLSLLRDLEDSDAVAGRLSKRAEAFFSQDIFLGIADVAPNSESTGNFRVRNNLDREITPKQIIDTKRDTMTKPLRSRITSFTESGSEHDDQDTRIKFVKPADVDGWEESPEKRPGGRLDIDIITAEAMTLAHQLATGQKTSHEAIDDGFNKLSFRDRDGLPEWFLEDESKHDKPTKPITRAAAQAIKEKLRAFNARPIKKVREAKARKKLKVAQKLERLKKKSDVLANDEGMTEKEKAESIAKLLSRATRKKPAKPAKLVVARGPNRGIQGRPKGVKGRYRMVDPRMKKELRAQKRVAQRKKT
ncbi:hypothetical protein CDD83_3176 [Cordyceps sp. RAO-2017]|nr:hypothetical protein CDD83_3176 [Cordyceps sp. RAO-2017]